MNNQRRNFKIPFIICLVLSILLAGSNLQAHSENGGTQSNVSELTAQIESISAENESLAADITQYQEELKKLNEEKDSAKQLLAEANSKIEELSKLEDQQKDVEKLKEQIEELSIQNSDKDAEIKKLQSEIAEYEASKTTTSATAETEDDQGKASETNVTSQQESTNNTYTVYITKTGSKYHRSGCRYLSKSQISIDKNDAISQGYSACSVCNP